MAEQITDPTGEHAMGLSAEIGELLRTSRGMELARRLFWQVLEFDRVNAPIPPSILPAACRRHIAECCILARHADVHVCCVRLLASELLVAMETPLLQHIGAAYPVSLIVFLSFGDRQIDIWWQDGPSRRRLILDEARDCSTVTGICS